MENEIRFNNVFNDLMGSLFRAEMYAMKNNINNFPSIFFRTKQSLLLKDTQKVMDDILVYVLNNLSDYVKQHQINVQKIDRTKIIYWVGMYIFEEIDSPYGVRWLQALILEDIKRDTSIQIDIMMSNKINALADKKVNGERVFFKYYGRFGLYHSLKQIHKSLKKF